MHINGFWATVLSVLISTGASASSFNAVADFSSSNPSGAWAYGTGTTGASFTSSTVFTSSTCFGVTGISCWQPPTTVLNVPVIARNDSGATINITTAVLPTGILDLHPGPSTDTIVTWTAPTAGTYSISGFFELLDVAPTGVVGMVYDNASQIFTATLTGPPAAHPDTAGGRASFSLLETVPAGTIISFGVNNDGSFLNDSTGLDATVTSVNTATPEPASFMLLVAGFTGLYALRLRRSAS